MFSLFSKHVLPRSVLRVFKPGQHGVYDPLMVSARMYRRTITSTFLLNKCHNTYPKGNIAANSRLLSSSQLPVKNANTAHPPSSSSIPFLKRPSLRALLSLIAISLVLLEHAPTIVRVNGPSMAPYLNKDYSTNHLAKDFGLMRTSGAKQKLERGMIVIFQSPSDPTKKSVKRIIGLPGDRVSPRPDSCHPTLEPNRIVPWNHVWVEGDSDDSGASLDSNAFGPISRNLITGQVVSVLWPRPRMLYWQDWETYEGGKKQRTRVEKDVVAVEEPPSY